MDQQFEAYFKRADLDDDGRISRAEAVSFFRGSGLSEQTFDEIWTYVDENRAGFLRPREFYNALKLITVAQSKQDLTPDIVKATLHGPSSANIPPPQISLPPISVLSTPAPDMSTPGLPSSTGWLAWLCRRPTAASSISTPLDQPASAPITMATSVDENTPRVIDANSFELLTSLILSIQQNQFTGLPIQNPNEHLNTFLEKCDSVKTDGISNDVLRLRLFPFSLRDLANEWLKNGDPNSYDTWDQLSAAFLHKFIPQISLPPISGLSTPGLPRPGISNLEIRNPSMSTPGLLSSGMPTPGISDTGMGASSTGWLAWLCRRPSAAVAPSGSTSNLPSNGTVFSTPLDQPASGVTEITMTTSGDDNTPRVIDANSFELITSLIQSVQQNQFSGLPIENPNEHLNTFLEKCDSVKTDGISNDVLRLGLFPFSLRYRAKEWLKNGDPNSYDTWDKLSATFLHKFIPPEKTAKHEITSFVQHDTESLYEAWERFKELQRQCPDHGVPSYLLILIFYNGVKTELQMSLNVAAGGALDGLAWDKAKALIEEMASNTYHWGHDRHVRGGRLYNDFVQLIIDDLSQQRARLSSGGSSSWALTCQLCGVQGHYATDCGNVSLMEQANALYSIQPFDPFPNTYNLGLVGWSFDPNLNYRNTTPQPPVFQASPQFRQIPLQEAPQKSNLELRMEQMLASQSRLTASHDQLSASQSQFMASQELKIIELSNKLSQLQNQVNSSPKMNK